MTLRVENHRDANKFAKRRNKIVSKKPNPITSPRIKHLAGKGLKAPSTLTTKQVRELAASVEAHIARKKK
jgi:hypothetical protein